MRIPLVDLQAQYRGIKSAIDKAIADVIAESAFIGGRYVEDFETAFAEAYGVRHCVSVANGTDALYIIMKMLGVGPGDEVITTANSWISSSETITQTGARPVFVDVHPGYFSMDEQVVEGSVTPTTKAIVAVHLYGQMCDLGTLEALCRKHKLILIEDCAQAHFADYKGVRAGLRGTAGAFSFYPGKNLGAYGDAGCIITNDGELAARCRMYANHGALTKHQHEVEGVNSRLDGLQAAVLLAKLPHVLRWTEQRIEKAALYTRRLEGITEVETPIVRPGTTHTWHLYVIKAERRDALMRYLKDMGVATAIHYPTALPLLPAYRYLGKTATDFPVAAALQHQIVSLPMFPELTEEQVRHVTACMKRFYAA